MVGLFTAVARSPLVCARISKDWALFSHAAVVDKVVGPNSTRQPETQGVDEEATDSILGRTQDFVTKEPGPKQGSFRSPAGP